MNELHLEYEKLEQYLCSLESVAVAPSGGMDPTFLPTASHKVLGDKAVTVTVRSCSSPQWELSEAKRLCDFSGVQHVIADSEKLRVFGFSENPVNRCYLCKAELFQKIREVADRSGLKEVVEDSNLDDNGDCRPGLITVTEQNVKGPLRHCDLSKTEIRILLKELCPPIWSKPSFICLPSRFLYGERIMEEKPSQIDKAEQVLLDLGSRQVRVRHHGNLARTRVEGEQYPKLLGQEVRHAISDQIRALRFVYVPIDITGYRIGSMSETLAARGILQEIHFKLKSAGATIFRGPGTFCYYSLYGRLLCFRSTGELYKERKTTILAQPFSDSVIEVKEEDRTHWQRLHRHPRLHLRKVPAVTNGPLPARLKGNLARLVAGRINGAMHLTRGALFPRIPVGRSTFLASLGLVREPPFRIKLLFPSGPNEFFSAVHIDKYFALIHH